MSELHEALKELGPTDWTDVPLDSLPEYLTTIFTAGELICNSVPPPAEGTPFASAAPLHDTPNIATTAKEVHKSDSRAFPPHDEHVALQKGWGKPMKFSASANPHGVNVHKMAGHDRHGAWFARTSIHEGMGFAKFKAALQREFAESLAVEGGPGVGAIRGITADKRLEVRESEGVGKIEAFQLSAQFPGPTTPREFITMLVVSDDALTEKSAAKVEGGDAFVPRHYMTVSKPLSHPDAPERSGYVRGQYESVEMIREIPLHITKNGDDPTDPELNPVEWIMITRSDPGGGLPRFLVDRGTPDAMLGDVTKFLNWATGSRSDTSDDSSKDPNTGLKKTKTAPLGDGIATSLSNGDSAVDSGRPRAATEPPAHHEGGMFSGLANSMQAGIDAYAPAAVSNQVNRYFNPEESSSSSSSDTSSVDSFMSAEELRRLSTAPEQAPGTGSSDDLSLASASSNLEKGDKSNMNHHDREVQKIMQQRQRLDRKLAKKRLDEDERLKKSQEKEQSEQDKARERHEREMKKTEEKHQKEIAKLESKKEKEARKAEARRKKKDEGFKLSMVTRERDDFRSQTDLLRRENELLIRQMEELQRENTALASRLGKMGGDDALRLVREEIAGARRRAGSVRSRGSGETTGSKKSGEKAS